MRTITPTTVKSKVSARPTRGQARFAFTILLIINILNYTDRFVLPAILPKVRADLGLTGFQAGLLGSSFLLVYAFATLPIGVWADRSMRKNIVALCVGIWSIATVLAGITRNFVQLFSALAILGIGEAGYAPASLSLLGDYFSNERRGRILSYWSAGQLIGVALGLTLGGLIADSLGWRWAYYLVGIPGLIAAFLAWRVVEPKRGAFEQDQDVEEAEAIDAHGSIRINFRASVRKLLQIPTYRTVLGALIFSFFTIGGVSFWLPSYLSNTFHLTIGRAGITSGAVLIGGGLLGTVLGGWLADYIQRRRPQGRLITATLGFLVGAPLAFLGLTLHNLAVFIAVIVVAITFLSFCTGPLNAVVQDIVIPQVRATAIGLALLLAHLLGDAASPSIIGFIADRYTLGVALLTTAPTCLLLAGLVCLLGLSTVARDMRRMQEQMSVQDKKGVEM
jgi:MFS transporter, Spinster family, sphingosine-1-phosphate transporter